MSLSQRSTRAFSFATPRGQSRSTSTRSPSALSAGTYTRLIRNWCAVFSDAVAAFIRMPAPGRWPMCRRRVSKSAREHVARAHRRVAEIGEHAVDAQPVELQIFLHGVQPVIGCEEHGLVAKRIGMDGESRLMGVGNQRR